MADGKAIEGANGENYTLTEAEIGKVITVAVTSSIETGSLVSAPIDAVIKEELKNDHLIINQVYGGGANDSTPVSHSLSNFTIRRTMQSHWKVTASDIFQTARVIHRRK